MVHRRPHSVLHDMHLCCSRARHRVFSLVEAMYGQDEQMRALADQMQAALMLRADGKLDSLEIALPTTHQSTIPRQIIDKRRILSNSIIRR